MTVNVKISKPPKDIQDASKLIELFLEKNSINTNVTVYLDYSLKDAGVYYYYVDGPKKVNPAKIYVNPYESIASHLRYISSYGYSEDYTIPGVLLHEFSHFIGNKFDLDDKFESTLILNDNCLKNKKEHLAEVLRLYLTNPYFLYLLSEPDFNFFKDLFSSPTPCSKEKFLAIYSEWTGKAKRQCKKKWHIYAYKNEVFQIEKA